MELMVDQHISKALMPFQNVLANHAIYNKVVNEEQFKTFMEFHIFEVLENILIRKRLEMGSDFDANKLVASFITDFKAERIDNVNKHFFQFYEAMEDVDADITVIDQFIFSLKEGKCFEEALVLLNVDASVKYYLDHVWTLLNTTEDYLILGAYVYSRIAVVCDIFQKLANRIKDNSKFELLFDYMTTYAGDHFQSKIDQKKVTFSAIIGKDFDKIEETKQMAIDSFYARMKIWDSIVYSLRKSPELV